MKQIFIFLCAAVIITACDLEKEIDIDGVEFREAINISGHISRQYGANVFVECTYPPQSHTYFNKKIDDAKVYLTSGGVKIAEIPASSYFEGLLYHIDIDTFSYNSYGVLVESGRLGTAYSAEQTLPDKVAADSVVVTESDNGSYMATFYFSNDENLPGYYCNARTADRDDGDIEKLFHTRFYGSDAIHYQEARKKDYCQISCVFYPASSGYDELEYYADFITLSPDLAKYLKSEAEYNTSQEDEFFDYPYPLYSNIKGGYGFFGAYTVSQTSGVIKGNNHYYSPED